MVEYLKHLPKPLLEDIVQNQCIPIIGAGFSLNAELPKGSKMPLWDDLGQAISKEMKDYPYSSPIDAISAYCYEFSRAKLVEKLAELLYVVESKPSTAHDSLARVPFDIVCTTNFDFLLEKAYDKVGKYCRPVIEEEQLPIATKQFYTSSTEQNVTLLKLHGDLHHPNRIVATEKDYDTFLNNYPLISTYLANLLITRTPLFIGYSLDDPDFRQVWQVIKERMGSLCRPAYSLVVNANPSSVAKFNRRGVKVINIPGRSYKRVFETLFEELRNYWVDKLPQKSTILNDQAMAEFSLPLDASSRLCYFAVSYRVLPFYKTFIYPMVEEFGLTPVASDEFISLGDNIAAREAAIVRRAQIVIVDVDSERQLFEVNIALTRRKKIPSVLIIGPKGRLRHESLNYASSIHYVIRSDDPFDQPDFLIQQVGEWLSGISDHLRFVLYDEPKRLLEKKEYNAAVVSAITLLETNLRKKIEQEESKNLKFKIRPVSLIKMLSYATQLELIPLELAVSVKEWIHWRNQVVHGQGSVSSKLAREIVYGILEVLQSIEQAAGAKL